jgi:hypothetical protein
MIQSNGIFNKKQGKKASILGIFHGCYFFHPANFKKQDSGPNVYTIFNQGNFRYNPDD